jgi:hypothetical protein
MADEVVTMAEMEKRYPDEWVLIGQPQTDKYQQVLSGIVLHHSKDHDEVWKRAQDLQLTRCAVLYMEGPESAGRVFIL